VTRRHRQRSPLAVTPDGALAEAAIAGLPTKERIQKALQGRFFLRVHMFVILGTTIGAGMVSTRVLYFLHFTSMAWRYGIAVLSAYAVFLGLVRLWLAYVGYCISTRTGSDLDWLSGFDFSSDGVALAPDFVSSSTSESSGSVLQAGGGKFGGGGASGSWGDPETSAPMRAVVSGTSKASSSSGKGGAFGLDVDEDLGLIILIVVLALAIAVAAFWVIWAAPVILGEAAFQAALAAALARKTKKMTRDSTWVGSVVKSTILPFLGVFAAAVLLGWYAHQHCPQATRLADAFHCDRSDILPGP
jgi:hypothetical protein